jgi:hypothetical protein
VPVHSIPRGEGFEKEGGNSKHVQPTLGAERLGCCAAGQTDSFCADQFGKPVIFAIVSTLGFGVFGWMWQVR